MNIFQIRYRSLKDTLLLDDAYLLCSILRELVRKNKLVSEVYCEKLREF